jgi:tetratricopeptide (TPR) repeat protein
MYQGRIAEGVGMARAVFNRNRDLKRTLLLGSGRANMAYAHAAAAEYDSVEYYSVPIGETLRGDPEILARSQLARGQMTRAFATLGVRARGAEGNPPSSRFSATNEALAASVTVVMLGDRASASRRLDAVLADKAFHRGDPANRPIDVVVALALGGRARDARVELTKIERASDADVRTAREPELLVARGAVALAEKRFPEAITALQDASLSVMLGVHACRICVLPLLGRAYEAAGQPDSALAVYERFLSTGDPDRIFPDGIWRARVLVRLGDLHARRGEPTQAAARFAQFVTLWKEADPEVRPQVDNARRRIIELRGSVAVH